MNISVYKENAGKTEDNLLTPDVVQNRFGVVYGEYTMLLLERDNREKIYIPLHIDVKTAAIGICLTQISQSELIEVKNFIFKTYKQIKQISCEYSLNKAKGFAKNYIANQWHLSLPKTSEELWERMSSKSKQTLRRKHNHLVEQLGHELDFKHYTVEQGIPDEIVEVYFAFKKELMNRDYGMTSQEYLNNFYVTDVYAWKSDALANNPERGYMSMVFTCEQGENVYLENLSYNPEYQKESPGFLLYCKVIEELIKKGKKEFFLGRKYRDYKQKFDSQNTNCYDVLFFRSLPVFMAFICKKIIKKLLRK
ncbi:MAG: GNAT family N-acetyltransferase [Treponema sp.]|uniref:GNAT family N-acetyltransferase n=1 Tax=Treponema sp. TaxID=166 RepID=UPI0025ED1C34|nr:GNAT family N-acetyltransferase [Treponema sp.]MBQ8679087.1 GNAT family N-acetyltransferase [Treponema sp.]